MAGVIKNSRREPKGTPCNRAHEEGLLRGRQELREEKEKEGLEGLPACWPLGEAVGKRNGRSLPLKGVLVHVNRGLHSHTVHRLGNIGP